jgi:hypothetical protein
MWDPVKNVCTKKLTDGKRCLIDEECQVCTKSTTGLVCTPSTSRSVDCPDTVQCNEAWMKSCKSRTGKCDAHTPGYCSYGSVATRNKASSLENEGLGLQDYEEYEYTATKPSYEYQTKVFGK